MRQLQVSAGDHCLCVLALTDWYKPTQSPNNHTKGATAVHMCASVAAMQLFLHRLAADRPCRHAATVASCAPAGLRQKQLHASGMSSRPAARTCRLRCAKSRCGRLKASSSCSGQGSAQHTLHQQTVDLAHPRLTTPVVLFYLGLQAQADTQLREHKVGPGKQGTCSCPQHTGWQRGNATHGLCAPSRHAKACWGVCFFCPAGTCQGPTAGAEGALPAL